MKFLRSLKIGGAALLLSTLTGIQHQTYAAQNINEEFLRLLDVENTPHALLKELLEQGADVNAISENAEYSDNVTPLQRQMLYANLARTKFLLENGANPNIQDWERRTAIHYLTDVFPYKEKPEFKEILELFIKNNADFNYKWEEQSILEYFARQGYSSTVEEVKNMILELGGNLTLDSQEASDNNTGSDLN